ncbi:MAG TPA: STAS domain-containing protein [Pseudonocardia sp.]|jgi:anti-anti-sigma factor|nr:STAS domain-containing protein [Pseudonocardia sp.]
MLTSHRYVDGAAVLTVSGAIDSPASARELDRLLRRHSDGADHLVLDMVEVTALGPVALAVLAERAMRADSRGSIVIVIGERHDVVLRAVEKARLLATLRLFDSVEHALAAGARRLFPAVPRL